jgi:hypothetical protein
MHPRFRPQSSILVVLLSGIILTCMMAILSCANSTKETMMMDKSEKGTMAQEKAMDKGMMHEEKSMAPDKMMKSGMESKEGMPENMKEESMKKEKMMEKEKTMETPMKKDKM